MNESDNVAGVALALTHLGNKDIEDVNLCYRAIRWVAFWFD